MKNIIVAPNAFKGALNASRAAESLATGLRKSRLSCKVTLFPIGDGGDGTCHLLCKALDGMVVELEAKDPLGRVINTSYGIVHNGETAVIEMANIVGLRLLNEEERDPMKASGAGVGTLILDALEKGVSKVIIGMGGSAMVDGGCGILQALGARFYDQKGKRLRPVPEELKKIGRIDLEKMDSRVQACEIVVLCDVDNPLLGKNGAAAVFGPQKGAAPSTIPVLEAFLERWRELGLQVAGVDMNKLEGGGTAGGAAAGMSAFLNAKLVSGIDYFLSATGFDNIVKEADVVITGEGSIDEQTLSGKAPAGVAKMAHQNGIPVIGVAGSIPLSPSERLTEYFDVLLPVNNALQSLPKAIDETEGNLVRTGSAMGNLLAIGENKNAV